MELIECSRKYLQTSLQEIICRLVCKENGEQLAETLNERFGLHHQAALYGTPFAMNKMGWVQLKALRDPHAIQFGEVRGS